MSWPTLAYNAYKLSFTIQYKHRKMQCGMDKKSHLIPQMSISFVQYKEGLGSILKMWNYQSVQCTEICTQPGFRTWVLKQDFRTSVTWWCHSKAVMPLTQPVIQHCSILFFWMITWNWSFRKLSTNQRRGSQAPFSLVQQSVVARVPRTSPREEM